MTERHVGRGVFMPSYAEVAQALSTLETQATPAEFHGMVCAFLCSGSLPQDGMGLLKPILAKAEISEDDLRVLLHLYHRSREQLEGFEFDFELLLPDDDAPLSVRAQAMSEWCQGFMIGLKQMALNIEDAQSPDSREALQRFLELAILDYDSIDVSEEDEKAFFEVSEYVRLAVVMIGAELRRKHEVFNACEQGILH